MSRNQKSGFTRQPRVADQMTPDLIACVEQGLAAERAGDARAALEWHRAVPMFRRGQHRYLLEQIASFDGAMPDWLWARWIAYQTTRCEDGATGQRMLGALKAVTEIVHPDLLERCFRRGGDPIRVTAQVVGESWAFHQYVVHEAGGLRSFIREHATGELAAHTALAEEWAGAPMSGYEIGASAPGARIAVREVGSLGWTGVLDLGAGTLASRDGWVIGRLVPSGVDDLLMFDMPPLGVPEKVARAVASPGDDWLAEVAIASRTGVLRSARILREDHEVVTDVQGSGYDDVSVEVLSRAVDGDLPPGDQARVAAAVLNPRIQEEVRRQLVRPGHPEAWVTWAARTPNPARGRLLALAHAARASA